MISRFFNTCRVYLVYTKWNSRNSFQTVKKPILIPSVDIYQSYGISLKKKVKLGRLTLGDLTLPTYGNGEEIWFNIHHNSETYFLNFNNKKISASLLSFLGMPTVSNVSLIKQTRSDLLCLKETIGSETNVRAWNPLTYPKGPWVPSKCSNVVHGSWIFPMKSGKCLGLCGRTLLLATQSKQSYKIKAIQLLDPKGSYFDNGVNRSVELWEIEVFKEGHSILDINLNEYTVAVLYECNLISNRSISLLEIQSGKQISHFPLHLPYNPGFNTVGTKICLTRFHLLAYNSNNMVIYDLFQVLNIEKICPRLVNVIKLPYVGREVKLDLCDDGSLFILAPIIQNGEVVVFNVNTKTQSTYLLQNAYSGSQPKSGCWFIFSLESCKNNFNEIQVEWAPINV